ncbi:putative cas1 appressorium specific protein [Diaporthe ampelina]|uniref:Putative cas1 appressorium specific protein n=1 Tax=Diaporthe ampelina TaxID=1214573 RepID=A0A0G2F608_9PEZI|nr:putative cas1 appressorium specific protein [Diaporthe ampelina]
MLSKAFILSLVPLVAAHGKVAQMQGDVSGNTTALAIQGGVVPGPGRNAVTEVDTTVFGRTNIQSNGLGRTQDGGKNTVAMVAQAQELSGGGALPQVQSQITGVFHVVTSDGCGSVKAVIDPTATGAFADGTLAETTADVPGTRGQCPRSITKKSYIRSLLENTGVIQKRATNVNQDFNVAFTIPAGTNCTGEVNGEQGVCLMKIANNNAAGPFGGVIAFQMANGAVNATAPATGAGAGAGTGTGTGTGGTTGTGEDEDADEGTGKNSGGGTARRHAQGFHA